VLEGRVGVQLGGAVLEAEPGAGDEPARLLEIISPASTPPAAS
jgi:hypothetical protein